MVPIASGNTKEKRASKRGINIFFDVYVTVYHIGNSAGAPNRDLASASTTAFVYRFLRFIKYADESEKKRAEWARSWYRLSKQINKLTLKT